MAFTFVLNEHKVQEILHDPEGMVGRDLQRRALNVVSQAKLNATGIPVDGANNPEGRGPRVDTGRLRSSITHELVHREDGTLVARVGTNVEYGEYLEKGLGKNGDITYPYLTPAIPAAKL